ncbi:MAG: GNAT family N-acetyltransferase [Ruminococcaceae bacterium]|nr:GNAT family N-acetyltransferase [Oscillospiraceae bacterium]
MIRISSNNNSNIIKYLMHEPHYNTYILGDIYVYGVDGDIVSLYVDDIDNMRCIVMKFEKDFVVYSLKDNFLPTEIVSFIYKHQENDSCISGKGSTIEKLFSVMSDKKCRSTKLACFSGNCSKSHTNVYKLTENDAEDILDLYCSISEFKDKYKNISATEIPSLFIGGRIFGIRDCSGKIIASAASTAESDFCAMITNVCVRQDYRKNGLSRKVMESLITDLQKNNICNICLYYDNPIAANLYESLGFKVLGEYKTLRNKTILG